MRSEIFIHIGLHKTGTTALQKFFATNEKTFNEHGIYFPNATREAKTDQIIHSNLSWELMNHGMFDPSRGTFADLLREIGEETGTDRRKWVISGEGLSRLPNPRKLLKAFANHKVTVVVYLRAPVDAAPSLYSEQLKAGCTLTFDEWISRKAARWLNPAKILRPWRKAIRSLSGKPSRWFGWLKPRKHHLRIIERPLDPEKLHNGSVLDDFLRLVDPAGTLPPLRRPTQEASNKRITGLECLALLFVNGIQKIQKPQSESEAVKARNRARVEMRGCFADLLRPFASTPAQELRLKNMFPSETRDSTRTTPPPTPPKPDQAVPIPEAVFKRLLAMAPPDLGKRDLASILGRIARFAMEQEDSDSFVTGEASSISSVLTQAGRPNREQRHSVAASSAQIPDPVTASSSGTKNP